MLSQYKQREARTFLKKIQYVILNNRTMFALKSGFVVEINSRHAAQGMNQLAMATISSTKKNANYCH